MKGLILNPHLLAVPLYIAGKSAEEVQEALGLDGALKLASNENPHGPSPKAIAALQAGLQEAHRYPGIAGREMRLKLAGHHGSGLTPEHFIIGNGATDVLRMIAQAFIFDGGGSVAGKVSFPLYSLLTTTFGGETISVDACQDLSFDLQAMARACSPQTHIVWLCSPNNPTGLVLRKQEAQAFVKQLPEHTLAVLDESYSDYVTDEASVESLDYVRQGLNVIVVRSFSKTAGLANLRVGYGVARPDLIEYLQHTVLPFNTGALVIRAACASLDDHEYHRRCRDLVLSERIFLNDRLLELGFRCPPSQANFVLVPGVPGGGQAFAEQLLLHGVIVRPMGPFGLPGAIRVSVGRHEDSQRFLGAFSGLLASGGPAEIKE